MSKTRKAVLAASFLFVITLGTIYLTGVAFFQTHLKIGTVINGFHCSFKSVEDAAKLLSREAESYALAVKTRNGGVEEITAEDAGLEFTGELEITDIVNSQDYYRWFIPAQEPVSLSPDCYRIDKKAARKAILNLKCMENPVEGKTAFIVNTNGTYQVSPGVRGTNINKKRVIEVIEDAVLQWKESVDLEQTGCYIDVVQADEKKLQEQCDFLNSIQDIVITYDFGDRKETITMDTVEKYLLDDEFNLTTDSVKGYVRSLANKYNTVGNERNFVTFDDRSVALSGGDYGWQIDVKKTSEDLIRLISERTVDVSAPVYSQTASSRTSNDIGYSYLEIDTANGTAVLYIDGTPVVQTYAEAGPLVRKGFWKVRGTEASTDSGMENAIFFDDNSCICRDPIRAVTGEGDISPNDILIYDQVSMNAIFSGMEGGWAIIIY